MANMKGNRLVNQSKKRAEGKPWLVSLTDTLRITELFKDGVPVRLLPYLLYFSFIAMVYIANSHWAIKTVRKIERTKRAVEDLRVDYTTIKADYMYLSKQSEVARNVKSLNLRESAVPPRKLKLEEEQ